MPLIRALERQSFSDAGPRPQVLNLGEKLSVMLLCLQDKQRLQAPESDAAETLFCVLSGQGFIHEGGLRHRVEAGDLVHLLPGSAKAIEAAGGCLTVLGVRALKGKDA